MAFVSGFNNDVFLSYAQVDNEALIDGDDGSRWVSTLKRNLQKLLDEKLGRKGSTQIWMDLAGLQGNEIVGTEIEKEICNTAALVVVYSHGYLASEWCRQEREIFLEAAEKNGGVAGRIFLVHRDEVDRSQWPDAFQNLIGYPFFERNPDDGLIRTLATPKPVPEERAYYHQLNKLRTELAGTLRRPSVEKKTVVTTSTSTSDSTPPENHQIRDAVFLAEVTPDQQRAREEIASFLQQQGHPILPVTFYNRSPEEFRAALHQDLQRSILFIQLLGPYPSQRSPDLPQGYPGLQLERALEMNVPILRWRRQDLDLDADLDDEHLAVLQSGDIIAMDLEEFKQHITDNIRRMNAQRDHEPTPGKFVLLSASPDDLTVVDQVSAMLESEDVNFDLVDDPEISIRDVADSDDYDALMVVYGNSTEQLVRQRVRECRQIALKKKSRAPICAVYIGPPDEKDPLRTKPPRFFIIDHDENGEFDAFLRALSETGA